MRIGDMLVSPAWKDAQIRLSLHWLVVSFFLLSCLFQWVAATMPRDILPNHVVRFVEYSFSASVMIVAIALQLGIVSAQSILLLAALTWTTMMIGLVAEILLTHAVRPSNRYLRVRLKPKEKSDDEDETDHFEERVITLKQAAWLAHLTAWVTQIVVFYVLLAHFHGSQYSCQDGEVFKLSAPKFVWAIVYVELMLFASFGFVQTMQLLEVMPAIYAEITYLVLSVCSKSALGALVYGGNFI